MRSPLVSIIALLAFSIGAMCLGQGAALGQEGTPRPEAPPLSSPIASPVACAEDSSPGRLVAVPNKVTIHLTDDGFDPGTIQTTNNTDLDLTLINTGTRVHSFVAEDFDLRIELAPGESKRFPLTPVDLSDSVTHWFYSDAPGDECMRGKLIFYI